MGAASVTGVGQGSADKAGQKGSEHLFVGVEKLIGVRVIHAGKCTLSSGTYAVKYPTALPGVVGDYIVICNGEANYAYAASQTVNGFTATGTGAQVVSYIVVRVDNATVTIG